jgi:hypothetical protein
MRIYLMKYSALELAPTFRHLYTVKKGYNFPDPSRDATNQTLPGQGEFGIQYVIPAGTEKSLTFFTV